MTFFVVKIKIDDTINSKQKYFYKKHQEKLYNSREDYAMGNSYKNCKIQDNTAELIYENGSLFVTIFENNIVHVAQKPGIESVAIEEGFIPKAATPDVTSKDTSDAKGPQQKPL